MWDGILRNKFEIGENDNIAIPEGSGLGIDLDRSAALRYFRVFGPQ
jgi:L-alanine-DL-glutamate epimerase-like enolase superfamily enzyme